VLQAIRTFREERKARRLGRKDGKQGYPLDGETEFVPFNLLAIKEQGDSSLWAHAQSWANEDKQLKSDFLKCIRALSDTKSGLDTMKDEYARQQLERAQDASADKAELESLEHLWRTKELQQLTATNNESTSQHDRRGTSEGNVPTHHASHPSQKKQDNSREITATEEPGPTASHTYRATTHATAAKRRVGIGSLPYWLIVIFVVLGEVPLNAFAFKLFGEADLLSYIMTLSVALILIACAHGLGIFLSRDQSSPVERLLTWILVLIPVLAILVIASVRNQYLSLDGNVGGLSPLVGTLAFALINILIYVGAVVLSYLRHDPDSEHNVKKEMRTREREDERLRKRSWKQEATEEKRRKSLKEALRREDQAQQVLEDDRRAKQSNEEDDRRKEQEKEAQSKEYDRRSRTEQPLREREEKRSRQYRDEQVQIGSITADLTEAHRELEHSRITREKRWEAVRARVMAKKNHYDRLMLLYCSSNVGARADRRTPPILLKLPEIEIPPVFEERLEWEDARRSWETAYAPSDRQ